MEVEREGPVERVHLLIDESRDEMVAEART